MRELSFQLLTGQAVTPWLTELARLRIEVFREYPYLYDGDLHYEQQYLQTYANSEHSLFVLACAGDQIIGAATGIPMQDETAPFQRPFIAKGWNPADIFYFGESVLLPQWRGRGIGVRFFAEREAWARELGLRWTCFCAVERPADHPRRPENYRSLHTFWRNRGYIQQPDLHTEFEWKELDEQQPSAKPMTFWIHEL